MVVLEWLNITAGVLLAARLLTTGIWRKYPFFFGLVCFLAAGLAASQFVPRNTNRFAEFYLVMTPAHWIMYGLAVYEAFRNVFDEHRGIASASRWAMALGVCASVAVAAASLGLEWSARGQKFPILYFVHLFDRAYSTTITLLILLLLGFLLWFPVVLKRNVLVLSAGLGLLFLAKTLLLLLRNLAGPETANTMSIVLQASSLVCLLGWGAGLSVSGEESHLTARRASSTEETTRLIRQLDKMNETLLRTAGR